MARDRDVAHVAESQHGVVHRRDAVAAGLSASGVDRRRAAGSLVGIRPQVLRIAGAPMTWRAELLAAVLSGGNGAFASHRSAAALWRLDGVADGALEITRPPGWQPDRPGIVVHRATGLRRVDVTEIDGIPVARIELTLVQLASVLDRGHLADAVDSALVQRLARADRVLHRLEALGCRGRRGAAVLRALLEERSGVARPHESRFERRLSELLVRHGLPRPVAQYEVRVGGDLLARVDLAYPDVRVAVEADGYRWHGGKAAWERDLARRTRLAAEGWRVLHFSWRDLVERPQHVVETVARLLPGATFVA